MHTFPEPKLFTPTAITARTVLVVARSPSAAIESRKQLHASQNAASTPPVSPSSIVVVPSTAFPPPSVAIMSASSISTSGASSSSKSRKRPSSKSALHDRACSNCGTWGVTPNPMIVDPCGHTFCCEDCGWSYLLRPYTVKPAANTYQRRPSRRTRKDKKDKKDRKEKAKRPPLPEGRKEERSAESNAMFDFIDNQNWFDE